MPTTGDHSCKGNRRDAKQSAESSSGLHHWRLCLLGSSWFCPLFCKQEYYYNNHHRILHRGRRQQWVVAILSPVSWHHWSTDRNIIMNVCLFRKRILRIYIQHVFGLTSLGSLGNPHPLWETFLGHHQQQSLIHSAMNHSIGVLISCPGWKAKTNFVFHQLQWQCVDKARFLVISGTPCTHHHLDSVPNTVIPIESVNDNYKLFPSREPNSTHVGSGGPRWCASCEPLSGHFSSAAPRSISGLSSSISNHSLWLLSSTRRNTDHKPLTDHFFFFFVSSPGEECALLPNKYILVPISTSSTSSSDTYSPPPLRHLLLSNFLWRDLCGGWPNVA